VRPLLDLSIIEAAAKRVGQAAVPTPLEHNKRLSDLYDANISIKREDLQPVRSFKIRGAFNKISLLDAEAREKGVVCSSAVQRTAWWKSFDFEATGGNRTR